MPNAKPLNSCQHSPESRSEETRVRAGDVPILQPRDFVEYSRRTSGSRVEGITKVLLCYDDDSFGAMANELSRRGPVSKPVGDMVVLEDKQMAIAGPFGIGAPAVVGKCEELIACGARCIISLGTAATTTHEISVGDVIVCDKAFSDEGTSRHYVSGRGVFCATKALAAKTRAHLNRKGWCCRICAAWTTDAPYRETANKRDAFLAKGASVADMEASALYMLASCRKVEALSVFVVGDSIAASTWAPHFNDERIRTRLKRIGSELLAFLIGYRLSGLPG